MFTRPRKALAALSCNTTQCVGKSAKNANLVSVLPEAAPRVDAVNHKLAASLNWFIGLFCTGVLGAPRMIKETALPIMLSNENQGTRFPSKNVRALDKRPQETGDHLFTQYDIFAFHNMMMLAAYMIHMNEQGMPVSLTINNGLGITENEKEYLARIQNTVSNWKQIFAHQNNCVCFAIQEGVVKPAHIQFFKTLIAHELSGWALLGGTEFGLWFLVRNEYAAQWSADHQLSSKLKEQKLDSRCLTLFSSTQKISNIHVPHLNPEIQYQKMVLTILHDMLNQMCPKKRDTLTLSISHIVSEKEHLKDHQTRLVSVSGITEFTLSCGDQKVIHHILGDFNLELAQRQQIDHQAFLEIQKQFTYHWVYNNCRKQIKYAVGLLIGGSVTLSTDFTAIDEVGLTATMIGKISVFS